MTEIIRIVIVHLIWTWIPLNFLVEETMYLCDDVSSPVKFKTSIPLLGCFKLIFFCIGLLEFPRIKLKVFIFIPLVTSKIAFALLFTLTNAMS